MSRIKEGLVFRTDKERLAWFKSLSKSEREEVMKEAQEIVDHLVEAFQPIVDHLIEAFRPINPLLLEAAAMSGQLTFDRQRQRGRTRRG